MLRFAGRLILLLAFAAILAWIGVQVWRLTQAAEAGRLAVAPRAGLPELEAASVALFERAAPSVVYLYADTGGEMGDGGAGSGFAWDRSGHIVTNYHVVEGIKRVRVRLNSGEAIRGRVVGTAPDYDLAVIQLIDAPHQLDPLPLGQSAGLKVGQFAFAIGNPYGLSRTLTTGIVSALDRRLPTPSGRDVVGAIQTDAAINPGNSGGPLLDSAGRLIGVTTAIVSQTGGSAGIGFAVPVDVVARIVPILIRDGRIPRPGIGILAVPEELALRYGYDGVVIAQVQPGSSAAQAGLRAADRLSKQPADIITHAGGRRIANIAELAESLERAGIGQRIDLIVERDGRSRKIEVTVMDVGG